MPPGASQGDSAGVVRASSSRKRRRSSTSGGTWSKKRSLKIWKSASTSKPHKFRKVCYPISVRVGGGNPVVNDESGQTTCFVGGVAADDFNGTQFGIGQGFNLKQIVNWNELTELFDQYRIDKIELKVMYQSNVSPIDSEGRPGKTSPLPIMYYTPDFDDHTAPPSQASVLEYGATKMRILSANDTFSIFLKPNIAKAVYQGLTNAYESARPNKIDCNYSQVEHFGMKYFFRNWFDANTDGTANAKLTIQPIFHVTMFNDR